jgi:DNA polymerase III subunit delta'
MSQLLLHSKTTKQLAAVAKNPSHALGIVGAQGAGKRTLALEIAKQLLQLQSLENCAYFKHFTPDSGSITIEQAREIIGFTKLKTTGTSTIRRVIIIEQAETMTREAQNAILKVIEEPPADTVLILTLTSKQAVLPTIISRLQTLVVAAPTADDVAAYFGKDFATSDIQRAYSISDGNVGLLHALLTQNTEHPLLAYIEQAKTILKADTFERLTMIDDIAKSKQINELLYGLQQTAQSALQISAQNGSEAAVKRWQDVLKNTYEARELLDKNTQTKLVLTNLLIKI